MEAYGLASSVDVKKSRRFSNLASFGLMVVSAVMAVAVAEVAATAATAVDAVGESAVQVAEDEASLPNWLYISRNRLVLMGSGGGGINIPILAASSIGNEGNEEDDDGGTRDWAKRRWKAAGENPPLSSSCNGDERYLQSATKCRRSFLSTTAPASAPPMSVPVS